MKKRSLTGLALVSILALGAFPATAAAKSTSKQVFKVAVNQEMPTADLSMATDTISFTALNNVYEGIYRVDKNSKPQPAGAAEKATVSSDGLTYDIKLRKDAKWSNGDPVTAADYVYGWQRTVDPKTGSQYAYLFAPVKNATAINEGKTDKSQLGIQAVSDYELKITLETATPYFDFLLAFPSFFPQHQATVEQYGDKYTTKSDTAVYNGPFTLTEFDGPGSDTEWSYTKNKNYWDKKHVKLSKIEVSVVKEASTGLNMFQDGEEDDVILTGELAKQNANDKEYAIDKESRTQYIEMNQRKEDSPFRNKNLRMALSYAIDRKALVKSILGDGSVASTSLIPEATGKNPKTGKDFVKDTESTLTYNKKKAKQYWEKAKKELGIKNLSFKFMADDTDITKKTGEYIQGAWEETFDGMKVQLTTVPFSVRLDRTTNGDFDVYLGGWAADYTDPSSFTDLFVTGNSYNRGRWTNADYDAAVKAAATTNANDPEKRYQNLLDADKIINEDMGVIPVFQKSEGHMRASKVKGVVVHGAGSQYDYKWAYIKK